MPDHGHHTGPMRLEIAGKGKLLMAHTSLERLAREHRQGDGAAAGAAVAGLRPVVRPLPAGAADAEEPALRLALGLAHRHRRDRQQRHLPLGRPAAAARAKHAAEARDESRRAVPLRRQRRDAQRAACPLPVRSGAAGDLRASQLPFQKGPKPLGNGARCEHGAAGLPGPSGAARGTGGYNAHKGHIFNFLSAVRSRNVHDLRDDVLEGHLSTALVHIANISYRLVAEHSAEETREVIKDRGSDAVDAFDRLQEHLVANGVDFSKARFVVGPGWRWIRRASASWAIRKRCAMPTS